MNRFKKVKKLIELTNEYSKKYHESHGTVTGIIKNILFREQKKDINILKTKIEELKAEIAIEIEKSELKEVVGSSFYVKAMVKEIYLRSKSLSERWKLAINETTKYLSFCAIPSAVVGSLIYMMELEKEELMKIVKSEVMLAPIGLIIGIVMAPIMSEVIITAYNDVPNIFNKTLNDDDQTDESEEVYEDTSSSQTWMPKVEIEALEPSTNNDSKFTSKLEKIYKGCVIS